jgi:hypothetical protein
MPMLSAHVRISHRLLAFAALIAVMMAAGAQETSLVHDSLTPDLPPVEAQPVEHVEPTRSAESAARAAREAFGGRVLAVHWTGEIYRVKLLRRGEVRIVEIEGE